MEPPRDADATEASRITVSGHQLDLGEGLKAYATEQITGTASKYFGGVEDVAVTFSRTGKGGFGCSVRVHSGRDLHFDGYGEGAEAHLAFNQALGRVAKQLRRRKRALREDKPSNPAKEGPL
jgi:ribosome-associated translation inhibitor RaiA